MRSHKTLLRHYFVCLSRSQDASKIISIGKKMFELEQSVGLPGEVSFNELDRLLPLSQDDKFIVLWTYLSQRLLHKIESGLGGELLSKARKRNLLKLSLFKEKGVFNE